MDGVVYVVLAYVGAAVLYGAYTLSLIRRDRALKREVGERGHAR